MKCEYCQNEFPESRTSCPFCGAPAKDAKNKSGDNNTTITYNEQKKDGVSPYSRFVYMLLGIFFSWIGIQFLYARRNVLFWSMLTSSGLGLIAASCAAMANEARGPHFIFFISYPICGLSIIALILSFLASFILDEDGEKRKMRWF